jgi:cobaltochelatase CobN
MRDETFNPQTFNAQTQKLRSAVQQGESLSTRRSGPLGQIFFCDGCCCGRSEKGFPPLPKEMIKGTIQLTISGCLGPCDLANVFYLLGSDGVGQWFGGLSEQWHYETLIHWANECQQSGVLLPIPETLSGHRFARFDTVPITPQLCTLTDRKLHETS